VTRIRTLARFLDAGNFEEDTNPYGTPDPTATLPDEVYLVDRKSLETFEVVEFELAAVFDLAGVVAPKRQAIANICQWTYRSGECGYSANVFFKEDDTSVPDPASDVCGKRLTSCRIRFGQTAVLPFGSFPGVGEYNY
jgi:lambda family phage minor tail protein L